MAGGTEGQGRRRRLRVRGDARSRIFRGGRIRAGPRRGEQGAAEGKVGSAVTIGQQTVVENRHGPRGKRPGAACQEAERGRWTAERREEKAAPIAVAPVQKWHAPVAEAASSVVENEVRHAGSVGQERP